MTQRELVELAGDDLAAGRARADRRWSGSPSRVLCACVAILLVACTTQPTLTFAPTAPSDSPAASQPGATPSPPPPTAAPTELPGLITPLPPDPAAPWTGISWRQLDADDPLAQVRSTVRWRAGYIATGAVVLTGETSATPIWISTDGGTWRRLGPDVLGPATIVLGVGESTTGVVALTLQGGENACGGPFDGDIRCLVLNPPLQVWTSPDGVAWTPHPGPQLELAEECQGCGLQPPALVAGPAGLLALAGYVEATTSTDGVAWELIESGTIPPNINPASVTAFASGFAGVGDRNVTLDGPDTFKPIAITSPDGRDWAVHPIPVASLDPDFGATASRLVAGPEGLIAQGATGGAPGVEIWWWSPDGVSWTQLSDYPPLGTRFGFEDPGSGNSPNGTLIGNGDRMLAYRGEKPVAAWTSFDGRSWARLTIDGERPVWDIGHHPDLILTSAGVIGLGRDGTTWFGEPTTD
jgi:hypothetical protein